VNDVVGDAAVRWQLPFSCHFTGKIAGLYRWHTDKKAGLCGLLL